MSNRKDDFTKATKLVMAERVAWRCSFPDCNKIQIGPNSHDPKKRINLGKAAHISAASPEGPRYDSSKTSEQRKHISNGIWMCGQHADLIDADFTVYSVETLKLWKIDAERVAAENLKAPHNEYLDESSTLLQIGSEIIFYAHWKSTTANERTFKLLNPLIGDLNKIEAYVEGFNTLVETERYVVIESQGDARVILYPPKLAKKGREVLLTITVKNPPKSNDPKNTASIALVNGDLSLDANGNIAMVRGVDAVIQDIWTRLGTKKGECYYAPDAGTLISDYYSKYKDDLQLFTRLFKLEFIRVYFVQFHENSTTHIKRIEKVNIQNSELVNQRLNVEISVVLGNDEHWSGNIEVFVFTT